jgi:arsenate reductase
MKPLFPDIETYIKQLPKTHPVPARRQLILKEISDFIYKKHQKDEVAELVFICTHNSRRSHLAQVWASVALHYHGIENTLSFSGGTEATAFHPNAIEALERAGCMIDKTGGKNPVYLVKFAKAHKGLQAFSKKYNDKYNPNKGFCAIMTCSEADDACPVVLGMEKRIALTYEDPKIADGQVNEGQVYDDRCAQIAMEMFYMAAQVSAKNFR